MKMYYSIAMLVCQRVLAQGPKGPAHQSDRRLPLFRLGSLDDPEKGGLVTKMKWVEEVC